MAYSDEQLKYIKELRNSGLEWEEVSDAFNERYPNLGKKKTGNALRKRYAEIRDHDIDDDTIVKNLKSAFTSRKTASKLRKENKALIESQVDFGEIQSGIEALIKNAKLVKYTPKKKAPKKKDLSNMTIEPLVSDVHYGLETMSFNADIARILMREFCDTVLEEKKRCSKNYNIDKILIQLNGDIIQSATMHKDSGKSCHLTNAQQLAVAIESLFYDLILPIAMDGELVEVNGMCGNHDRESPDRFTVEPGTSYYTYTIYRSLELLCQASGLKNVSFTIPTGAYHIYEVYGHSFLIEHGDLLKGCKQDILENHLMKRSAQTGKILKGIRIGHFHNDYVGSLGRHIVNGSMVSDDHYGDGLGYVSRPAQIINYYVETKERDTSYYHSFVVNLG